MTVRIGITLGDVTGVGPEVTVKALADLTRHPADLPAVGLQFVLFGDRGHWEHWVRRLGCDSIVTGATSGRARPFEVRLVDPCPEPLPLDLPCGEVRAARAAVAWLEAAARACLNGDLQAMVTAPVHKEAIQRAGIPFVGQTEFLGQLAKEPEPVMMLLGTDRRGRWLRVALVTVHLALRQVPERVTGPRILRTIACAVDACHQLRLPRARIAVCGLNPHCGEGGAFGDEEGRLIEPAIAQARARGWEVVGPLSGDTVFYHALEGRFDAVVAMYHDQGLAPLKAVAFETGVNWSLGLPFIRTSPDHGTAYDIAGQGRAEAGSMRSALQLAVQLAVLRASGSTG